MRAPLLALTALLACGPGDPNSTDDTAASTGDLANTTGPTSTSATSATSATSTTDDPPPTTGPESTTIPDPITTAEPTTGPTDECEVLEQRACSGGCMPVFGRAYQFEGCVPGEVFLGCIPVSACDDVLLDVCAVDSDAAFQLGSGCVPPGFRPCAPGGLLCDAGACESLGEAECAPAGCTPISGAPHLVMGDEVCVDFDQQVFLGCLGGGIACRPSVPTVCPEGQPDTAFDVPAGCIPPGHVTCDMPASECP